MDVPETLLLDRALDGDAEALGALLERHGRAVRCALAGAIPKRWRSVLSLDDVVQQAYTDAFVHIRQFTPRTNHSLTDWLVVLARHALIDALRGLEADKRGGDRIRVTAPAPDDGSYDGLFQLLGATTSTPSRAAARDEGRAALRRAIDRLPEAHRRAVELYDLQGRSGEEVAAALGRSVGAIYMLRARAHGLLRELMGAPSAYLSTGA